LALNENLLLVIVMMMFTTKLAVMRHSERGKSGSVKKQVGVSNKNQKARVSGAHCMEPPKDV